MKTSSVVDYEFNISYGCRQLINVTILDIGDCSLFVNNDFTGAESVDLCVYKKGSFTTKEILPSPAGSVLYFDSLVSQIFEKGNVYAGYVHFSVSSDMYDKRYYVVGNMKTT